MNFKLLCKPNETTLRVEVYNSINDLDQQLWFGLLGNHNLYLSIPYLSALELSLNNEANFRYLLFYTAADELAGIAYTQFVVFKGNSRNKQDELRTMGNVIRDQFIDTSGIKAIVCGNAFVCGDNGFYHNELIDRAIFLNDLSMALEHLQKKEKQHFDASFVLFKEFWPRQIAELQTLKAASYHELSIDVNMVLPLAPSWKTFDDYLNSMITKFRTKAKGVFLKSQAISSKDLNEEEIKLHAQKIDLLYEAVLRKANYKFGEANANPFYFLKQELGEQFVFRAYFLNDELVAFSGSFVYNGIFDANHVGINYSYNREHALYQRMLYDFVKLAIDKNCSELRLGRTAEEIKSGIGALPVEMKLYTKHKHKISNKLIIPILKTVKPSPFELRSPFKAGFYENK